jgi:hypothetical protein
MSEYGKFIETNFNINNKKGQVVPFKLNDIQRYLDRDLIENKVHKAIVLKARQMGCSVFFLVIYIIECMRKHSEVVLVAHLDYAANQLFEKTKMLLRNIKFNVKLSKCGVAMIEFAETRSNIRFACAKTADTLRASTVNYLHLSELAFYKDPEKILIAAQNAIDESGSIIIESTANGFGYFRTLYYLHSEMLKGDRQFETFFYPWYLNSEYQYNINNLDEVDIFNQEEIQYRDKVEKETGVLLTDPQMRWRRNKIVSTFSTCPELFDQEFPYSEASAFLSKGGIIFKDAHRILNSKWQSDNILGRRCRILEGHPNLDYHYVLGCDTSGGSGRDDSAIVVLCIETNEQVYEFNYNFINPPAFADFIRTIGLYFNTALVVVESNSHGVSVLALLRNIYPVGKIYKQQYDTEARKLDNIISAWGWSTQTKTLSIMVDMSVKELKDGLKIYSINLERQLMEFYNNEFEDVKSHGQQDIAMAFMLSVIGLIYYRPRVLSWNKTITLEKKEVDNKCQIFDTKERTVRTDWFDDQAW